MNIGIIGTGGIGQTLAGHIAKAGFETIVSNSRGPESLAALVSKLGPRAKAGTRQEAAQADVVVFALPFLSVSVLNQQEFREEPVPDSISRNSFLPRRCFWSSGLLGIPAVRLDFS